MMRLKFADNTTLEVLNGSSSNLIQFTYNAETFAVDVAKFTDLNMNGAVFETVVEDVVTETQLISNRKVSGNITINNTDNIVSVGLLNMNSTEQKILQAEQQSAECMSAIDSLLALMFA